MFIKISLAASCEVTSSDQLPIRAFLLLGFDDVSFDKGLMSLCWLGDESGWNSFPNANKLVGLLDGAAADGGKGDIDGDGTCFSE